MIILSPRTARALAPHTSDQAWVMFAQACPPGGVGGPILIEGLKGAAVAPRLRQLAADNAYEVLLIGLTPSEDPAADELRVRAAHADGHLHHGWHAATPALLGHVQAQGQAALRELLGRTRRGAEPTNVVDIETIARHLQVSVPTVRRMVKAGEIPYLRLGKALRFVPADVIASLGRRA